MNPVSLTVGPQTTLEIPPMRDPDGDPFTAEVSYTKSATFPSFVTYDSA